MLPDFRLYYNATIMKKSMVQAQKKTHTTIKQNKDSINKPLYLRSIDIQQRRQKYKMDKRQSLQ